MRFLNYLKEEYEGSHRGDYGYKTVTVFVNPTKKEMIEAIKECNTNAPYGATYKEDLRFLMDLKKKKLYIWNGWAKIHQPMAEELGIKGSIYNENYIFGNAKVVNGKLSGLNNIHCNQSSSEKYDYKWMEAYFDKRTVESLKEEWQ